MKRQSRLAGQLVVALEGGGEVRLAREAEAREAGAARSLDVGFDVVDEEGFSRQDSRRVQRQLVDRGLGLEKPMLAGQDEVVESPQPVAPLHG